jgi:hypothetical protein
VFSRRGELARSTFLLSTLLIVAARAGSQQPAGREKASGAVLTGIAIDSIHGGHLAGASILVRGTPLNATTDSAGEFTIAGIPAGKHSLEVRHPLLDSLAISIATREKIFNDGDSAFALVGVPSAESVVASTCPMEDLAKGPAFVVGTVTDADTGKPSAGAVVTARWTDYEIGKKSISTTPQTRVAEVSPTGRFRMCGLPEDFVASLVASRGSDSTAALETSLSSLIGILTFHLPPPRAVSAAPRDDADSSARMAAISGRVFDEQGKPTKGASVAIEADDLATNTGQDGSFILGGLRPGTRWISVRKIGYERTRIAVDLAPGETRHADLMLGKSVTVLNGVVVTAARGAGLQTVGFVDRKRHENGTFLGPAELKFRDLHHVANILLTIPRSMRGGCVRYYVDGLLTINGSDPDNYLGGAEIGAVEFYSATFVPGRFLALSQRGDPCNAVVVWTKVALGLL